MAEQWSRSPVGQVLLNSDLLGVLTSFTPTHTLDSPCAGVKDARLSVSALRLNWAVSRKYVMDADFRASIQARVGDPSRKLSLYFIPELDYERVDPAGICALRNVFSTSTDCSDPSDFICATYSGV